MQQVDEGDFKIVIINNAGDNVYIYGRRLQEMISINNGSEGMQIYGMPSDQSASS